MALAIFDLDNTLIAGDSDYSWGQFLVDKQLVDADAYRLANDQFYQDYKTPPWIFAATCSFPLSHLPSTAWSVWCSCTRNS